MKKMTCGHCGRENVMHDAWAEWDTKTQKWVLGTIFDAGFCADCDGPSTLKEIKIESEKPPTVDVVAQENQMHYAQCNSHRARKRLLLALGREPQSYFTMNRDSNGRFRLPNHKGIYEIKEDEISLARSVKGISIVRNPEKYDFMKCVKMYS